MVLFGGANSLLFMVGQCGLFGGGHFGILGGVELVVSSDVSDSGGEGLSSDAVFDIQNERSSDLSLLVGGVWVSLFSLSSSENAVGMVDCMLWLMVRWVVWHALMNSFRIRSVWESISFIVSSSWFDLCSASLSMVWS